MNPADHDSLVRAIAFAGLRNMSLANALELTSRGAGPDSFFTEPPALLAARTGLRPEFFAEVNREDALRKAEAEAGFIAAHNIRAVFCTDADYPRRLAQCGDAPALLYVLGDCSLDMPCTVSVVGTRHSTAYGGDFAARLVAELAEALPGRLQIVSGLAYGIDIAAHMAAVREGVPTGAVLAHGLQTIYPADHRRQAMDIVNAGGFLATEYTSQAPIRRGNFLERNRIVAGMADAVVVVESDMRGGAMATARLGAAYQREVFALPGRVTDTYSRGCLDLIARETARPVRGAEDILRVLGWKAEGSPQGAPRQRHFDFEPDPERTALLRALREAPESGVSELCVRSGVPVARVTALLFEMEMDDLVAAAPGDRHILTPAGCEYLAQAEN